MFLRNPLVHLCKPDPTPPPSSPVNTQLIALSLLINPPEQLLMSIFLPTILVMYIHRALANVRHEPRGLEGIRVRLG